MKTRAIAILLLLALLIPMLAPAVYADEDAGSGTSETETQPAEPTTETTGEPTGEPTGETTGETTGEPTTEPTGEPTTEPTTEPTGEPTTEPTGETTEEPTGESSEETTAEDGTPGMFTVTYCDADMANPVTISTEEVAEGALPAAVPTQNAGGKAVTRWLDADGAFKVPGRIAVTADVSYYAWYAPALNAAQHIKYISGLGNAQFGPDQTLTRAQAAQLIYKLLSDSAVGPYAASFSDVASGAWYYNAVTTLASHKLISGYKDGTFLPNKQITRAEFIAILARFYALESGECSFTDVPAGYWAREAIVSAVAHGWVSGYAQGDGSFTFRPGAYMSRAEAVAVMNRVLGRSGDKGVLLDAEYAPYFRIFIDVPTSHWAYAAIMEASLVHEFGRDSSGEYWTSFSPDQYSCGLTPGFHLIGGKYYYVDDNELLGYFGAGFQELDGYLCHASAEGYALDAFTEGFNTVEGKLYRCSGDTYALDRNSPGYMEIGVDMYHVQADGSFLADGYYNNLYFGADGAYTSGDETVDSYVYSIVKSFINDPSLTDEQKLWKGYMAIRDGGYRYLNRGDGYAFGSSGWALDCAKVFYATKKGSCYYWAAGFLYVARRLGFSNAYTITGGIGNATSRHAWVMIDGYIYDVEIEWGWRTGYYGGPKYYDMFKQENYVVSTTSTYKVLQGVMKYYYYTKIVKYA